MKLIYHKNVLLTLLIMSSFSGFTQQLDSIEFRTLINQEFRGVLNSSNNNNLGTFASFDSKDSKITFSPTFLFNNGSILNLKFEGSASDNLLPLVQGGDLSPNFGATVQYHLISREKVFVEFDAAKRAAQQKEIRKIESDFEKKELEIEYYEENLRLARAEIIQQNEKIEGIKLRQREAEDEKERLDLIKKLKTAESELLDKELVLEDLEARDMTEQWLDADNERIEKLIKAKSSLKLEGFNMSWLSLAYGINNATFKHLEGERSLNQQAVSRTNLSHSVTINLAGYRYTSAPWESFYWSVGLKTTFNDDNRKDLISVKFIDQITFSTDSLSRVYDKSVEALEGDYQQGKSSFQFIGELYYFLFKDNQGALHVYGDFGSRGGDNSVLDVGFGFLFSFSTKDAKSVVNSELFYELADATSEDKDLSDKGVLGIRFNVPIKFK